MYFTSNDVYQNTFFYQATLDTLQLKKDKDTDYVLGWKSKRVYTSKLLYFLIKSFLFNACDKTCGWMEGAPRHTEIW